MASLSEQIEYEIAKISPYQLKGKVSGVKGLLVECRGIEQALQIGSRCRIENNLHGAEDVLCEVVGFNENAALLMPFHMVDGIGLGSDVIFERSDSAVQPCEAWLGRVINAMGEPIDGKGPLPSGGKSMLLKASPPNPSARARVAGKLDLGIRVLNTFLTCCHGQRMGIFAGSGVGKSILMSMLARFSSADVNVIGLVGERSREVKEFLEDDLGEEGLKRSVVVVATSSESALMRRQAAYMTLAISEYFRDQNKEVLCLMDSVTRFAMAQREIGLSAGEPPTSKGYTPTVFAELAKLLERAGPGMEGSGHITGLFSVLVEGDDTNEPVSDAVRGILDGHIVLDRNIAQRGRYPAVNILRSVSRMLPDCNEQPENALVEFARKLESTYDDMAEMIRLGAYRKGSDREVDIALQYHPAIERFIMQGKDERAVLNEGYDQLAQAMDIENWREQLSNLGAEKTE